MTVAQTGPRIVPMPRVFAVITVVGGLAAFVFAPAGPVGQQLWPAMLELNPPPTGAQIGLFMLHGAIESLAFGAGIAVLVLGREPIRRLFGPGREGLATASHLAVFWLLWSWWLHVAMHMTSGMQAGRLLFIEYAFHVTNIAAAAILAYALLTLGRNAGLGANR